MECPDVYQKSSPTYGKIHSDISVMHKQLQVYSDPCKTSLSMIYIELFISTKPHQTLGYRGTNVFRNSKQDGEKRHRTTYLVNLVIRQKLCLVLFNVKKYKQLHIKHFRMEYRRQDTI